MIETIEQDISSLDRTQLMRTRCIWVKPQEDFSDTPGHLGGHGGHSHTDLPTLRAIIEKYDPFDGLVDIGCGVGAMRVLAEETGLKYVGIDGAGDSIPTFKHDYSVSPSPWVYYPPSQRWLGWSVEFLEHVEEQFIPNFMLDFQQCKVVFATHAVPGQGGTHHVNCQEDAYWIQKFSEYGFDYDTELASAIRCHIGINHYVKQTGMVFVSRRIK